MKVVSLVLGMLLVATGIAGLVPSLTQNGVLFGVMPMNTAYAIAFIAVGAIGLFVGLSHRHDVVPPGPRGPDLRPWV